MEQANQNKTEYRLRGCVRRDRDEIPAWRCRCALEGTQPL